MLRESAHTYTHTYTHTHTHIHTHTFSDLVELSRMVYNTRGLRSSDQMLVFQVILYPFYRERQNTDKSVIKITEVGDSHENVQVYRTFGKKNTNFGN